MLSFASALRNAFRTNTTGGSTGIQSQDEERGKKMNMLSKPKKNGSAEGPATSSKLEKAEVSVGNSARQEEIRCRAYEIYLGRGGQPGHELDDWLQAECELAELERGILRLGKMG
jgi:hypothetical protein